MNAAVRDKDGEILAGGHRLSTLVARFGSPLYVYDFDCLRKTYRLLRERLHPAAKIHYAIKANPNPAVVEQFVSLGAGFDVSSIGETRLALGRGADPRHMGFAGPGKTDNELREAVAAGVTISVESLSELRSLQRIGEETCRSVLLAVRVNPSQYMRGYQLKMGGVPSQFGIDQEQLDQTFAEIARSKQLSCIGLHVYAGTQILAEAPILESTGYTLQLARDLAAKHGVKFETVNIGGGWGVPYHEDDAQLDESKLIDALNQRIEEFRREMPETAVIVELGRYLVGPAGFFAVKVVRTMTSRDVRFLVLDGGMHHFLAASGNFGQVLRRNFPVSHASKVNTDDRDIKYNLVGPLCTPIDRMGTAAAIPEASEGDILVFTIAGAYAYSASPLLFLSHPSPAEVAVDGQSVIEITPRHEGFHK